MSKTQEPAKRQSHNLSQDQLVRLQEQQSGEQTIKKVKSNGVDPDYEIPEHEKHLVHVRLETPNFDRTSGAKLSVPFEQTFYAKEFAQMEKDNNLAGYKVDLLHDPSKEEDQEKLTLNITPEASAIAAIDTTLDKPMEEMSSEELVKTYRKFYSEQPLPEWTMGELMDKINERIDFIETKKEEYLSRPGVYIPPQVDKGIPNQSLTVEEASQGQGSAETAQTAGQAQQARRSQNKPK